MKRIVRVLALTAVLVALLAVAAGAADFTHCADALKELGLFQGSDQGYDLDRAPTRAEAAAMLVRLLGKEAEAKASTAYTAPFTDVADWAKPYVQYLYDNGLTNGKTATAFGYADRCTAQQYAVFLLRALGYSDAAGGDFTYAAALDFAREKGVVDVLNCNAANFLRDDVAAMSYTALSVAPKSGEADLLTKLVSEGAVQDAKGYDKLFAGLRSFAAAQSAGDAGASAAKLDIEMDMKLANVDYLSGKIAMDLAAVLDEKDPDQSKMAMDMDIDMAFTELAAQSMGLSAADAKLQAALQCYYTDGALYLNMDGVKVRTPLSLAAVMPAGAVTAASAGPVSAVSSLEHTAAGGVDRYTITYAAHAMDRVVETAGAQAGAAGYSMGYDAMTVEMALRGGQLQSAKVDLAMHAAVEGMAMHMTARVDLSGVKTGSAVQVRLPADLSSYQNSAGGSYGVIGGADGPTSIFTTAG
ncbi:MAG: hypothetical protein HFF17_03620 [Oscillospiraceae bacterium]|nr:hypothetical protein [Oscillospiraceae bacterium]